MIGGLFQGLGAAGGGFATALRDIMERERMREYQNAQIGLRADELAFRRDQASEQKARWEAEHNRPQMANIHGIPTPVDDWRTADTAWHEQHPEPAPKLTGPAGRTYVDTPEGFDRLLADRRAWTAAGRAPDEVVAPEVVAPDGAPGTPARPPKLTEQEAKSFAFYQRGKPALQTMRELLASDEGFAAPPLTSLVGTTGGGVRRHLQGEHWQRYEQAAREALASVLRKDSGAAITDGEMDTYGAIYIPLPGDEPGTVRQKLEALDNAIETFKSTAGEGSPLLGADPVPVSRFGRLKGMGNHPENPYQ